ncbi:MULTISPECIES: folate-binding protein YgfZ [Corynebacterium]|uniref:CAF17-like 4Fe-4S cluster assembly/insertion protein YgfZ n=1 Tax=Corynebacterium TaxID=1716 RepID=UPI001CE4AA43|nr:MULTISPECIES: folate-binding protein [Corynebacterium]
MPLILEYGYDGVMLDSSELSPILDHEPGASNVADGAHALTAWHYGDPLVEQSRLDKPGAVGLVDGWDRVAIRITGGERLMWLNSLISQKVNAMRPEQVTEGLVLSAQGHVEHYFGITATEDALVLDVHVSRAEALLTYLTRMIFWADVQVEQVPWSRLSLIARHPIPDAQPAALLASDRRVGSWHVRDLWFSTDEITSAWDGLREQARPTGAMAARAVRLEARVPSLEDLDERTIPHEVPAFIGAGAVGATQREVEEEGPTDAAVHLNKGCYRGQETVSRVQNLGKAPRVLVLLTLDGSVNRLPEVGADVTAGGRTVGRVGSSTHHWEEGPIALALIKRAVVEKLATDPDQVPPLQADGIDVAIDPADVVKDEREAPGRAAIKRLKSVD